jgi:hypothetical protein
MDRKFAVKFDKLNDESVEVIYTDGNKETFTIKEFELLIKKGNFKISFVLPKEK